MKTLNIKILVSSILFIFILSAANAQRIGNLDGINYQAVAIDEEGREIVGIDVNGKPLYEKTISVRFSILKGVDGPVQYQETHTTLTDQYGLFNLVIGQGELTGAGQYDSLLALPWIDADQFLQVELSIENDGNYRVVSREKFRAVPYSFYTDDIADDAITTEKVLNEELLAEDIATGAVTTSEILDATILNEDIANGTIDLTSKVTNILQVQNGGTGRDGSTVADGQLLIGNTANGDFDLANLTPGTGINIVNTPGGIEISSGVQGVNSSSAGNVQVGSPDGTCPTGRSIPAGATWTSPSIPLDGVQLGNIMVGSINYDLQGCMMSTYVRTANQIEVSIYNGTGTKQCFPGNLSLRVLVVQ